MIRFEPPLSVRLRLAIVNVFRLIGAENVTSTEFTADLVALDAGPTTDERVSGFWSTSTLIMAAGETFPAASVAVTERAFAPAGRLSAIEKLVPVTLAYPRSLLPSITSTDKPVSGSEPVSVTEPVSVRPADTPVFGEIARLVGAVGAAVISVQVADGAAGSRVAIQVGDADRADRERVRSVDRQEQVVEIGNRKLGRRELRDRNAGSD